MLYRFVFKKFVHVLTLWVNNEASNEGDGKTHTMYSLGAVEPGAEELFEYHLKVPQLPPTHIDVNTISVSYTLHFAVKIFLYIDH